MYNFILAQRSFMKPLLVVLFLFFFQHIAAAQDADSVKLTCKDAHVGQFDVLYQNMKFRIKRDADFQYEISTIGYIKYKIKWTSECVYEMEVVETNIDDAKGMIGQRCTTTITSIEDNKMNYTCVSETDKIEMKGYMKKVSD